MAKKMSSIDLSEPRRRYYSDECDLTVCPECGSDLTEENITILLCVNSDSDEGEFMTNLSGSHFCNKCPVVVFDVDMIEQAARFGIKGSNNLKYLIADNKSGRNDPCLCGSGKKYKNNIHFIYSPHLDLTGSQPYIFDTWQIKAI